MPHQRTGNGGGGSPARRGDCGPCWRRGEGGDVHRHDGTYRVNVPPGAYDVTAELMGFDTTARTLNVPQEAVAQSCVQTIDFPMALAPRTPRAASAPAAPVPGAGCGTAAGTWRSTGGTGGTALRHAQRADAGGGSRGNRRGPRQRGAPAASARVFHRRAHPGAGRQREHGEPRPRDAERPARCDRPWRVRSRNRRVQPGVRAWADLAGRRRLRRPRRPGRSGAADPVGATADRAASSSADAADRRTPTTSSPITRSADRRSTVRRTSCSLARRRSSAVLTADIRRDGRRPGADQGRLQGRPAHELHRDLFRALAAATCSTSTPPSPTRRCAPGTLPSSPVPLIDPSTGLPFAGNVIPTDRLSAASQSLLGFIPLPNLDGETRNFHYVDDERFDDRRHQRAGDAQLHAQCGRPRRWRSGRRRHPAAGSAAAGRSAAVNSRARASI